MKLLSINADAKTTKSSKFGWLTGIMYLAPHKTSGRNVCKDASPACSAECLYYAGRGAFQSVQQARINRTNLFFEDRMNFLGKLEDEIGKLLKRAKKNDQKPCIRLNGTSDLNWEKIFPGIFGFNVQFYDYTKTYERMISYLNGEFPTNYHLTFSRSEINEEKSLDILSKKGNVAVVFKDKPKTWNRFKVYDGDESDLRFLDGRSVCGLKAKGKARYDTSGFVV